MVKVRTKCFLNAHHHMTILGFSIVYVTRIHFGSIDTNLHLVVLNAYLLGILLVNVDTEFMTLKRNVFLLHEMWCSLKLHLHLRPILQTFTPLLTHDLLFLCLSLTDILMTQPQVTPHIHPLTQHPLMFHHHLVHVGLVVLSLGHLIYMTKFVPLIPIHHVLHPLHNNLQVPPIPPF